ncbi:gastrin [Ochotona curzoniae]|uniref:gastrin n=1 Tax=Ochotona curzoniae TaxID=130825 RepID=UPI001B34A87B|nr:gastrin [Ochotona curzoniae]
MTQPCVSVLVLVLALAAFCHASWRPHSQLQDALSGLAAHRGLEPRWLDQQGSATYHRRQLEPPAAAHLVPDLSKKQGPWLQEEEEAYGWMDFGRRSAEEVEQHP